MGVSGNIPVIQVKGRTLPEAWEKAVLATWERGIQIRTEYDGEDTPPSRDCTMIMTVREPLAEPRIHRAFPAGLEELEIYRLEVMEGIHDQWINPQEGKWTYTYHQRLFSYPMGDEAIDQIAYIVDKLSRSPYSRRAQAITWNPKTDPPTDDPPCLQRLWLRLVEEGGRAILNMNAHWRSRDGFKAAFMNIFALTDLQRQIAEELGARRGEEVGIGRYVDVSDSFHIYGSYYQEFEGFLHSVRDRSFKDRTWTTRFAEPFFEEGRRKAKVNKI